MRRGFCIRILIVIGALEVGGAEMHLAQVLPRLAAAGFEIAVHTLTGRGPLAASLAAAGVRVIVPEGAGEGPRRDGFAGRVLRALRACLSLYRTMRGWRPDIVHFFLPEAYLAGAPVVLLASDAKRVMSRRSLNDYQRRHPFLAWVERRQHGTMHAIVGNSAAILEQLAAEGAEPGKLHLIHNGVDLDRFDGHRAAPGRSDGKLTLLIVANLIPYKGHADLIAALALAAPKLPNWRLQCVGRDTGPGPGLRALAEAAGIGGRIEWLGGRDDVPALMAAANIALLCSHEEGFPNAAIEAMAAGLPLIATRVGGVPEAARDGETALLVPPRDPAALAEAIVELANDPARRAAMGHAARLRVEKHFALDSCVDAYARLYWSLGA